MMLVESCLRRERLALLAVIWSRGLRCVLMIFEVALEGDAKESGLMYFVECFISDFEFNLTLQSSFIGVRLEKYSEVCFQRVRH